MRKLMKLRCPPPSAASMIFFKNGSDYTFEKKGTFTMTKGVVVEKGAKLKVLNSNIDY